MLALSTSKSPAPRHLGLRQRWLRGPATTETDICLSSMSELGATGRGMARLRHAFGSRAVAALHERPCAGHPASHPAAHRIVGMPVRDCVCASHRHSEFTVGLVCQVRDQFPRHLPVLAAPARNAGPGSNAQSITSRVCVNSERTKPREAGTFHGHHRQAWAASPAEARMRGKGCSSNNANCPPL